MHGYTLRYASNRPTRPLPVIQKILILDLMRIEFRMNSSNIITIIPILN